MQIICFSASANKLSNIQKQADEYAALIMEELDPDNLGYIMVKFSYHDRGNPNYFLPFSLSKIIGHLVMVIINCGNRLTAWKHSCWKDQKRLQYEEKKAEI